MADIIPLTRAPIRRWMIQPQPGDLYRGLLLEGPSVVAITDADELAEVDKAIQFGTHRGLPITGDVPPEDGWVLRQRPRDYRAPHRYWILRRAAEDLWVGELIEMGCIKYASVPAPHSSVLTHLKRREPGLMIFEARTLICETREALQCAG